MFVGHYGVSFAAKRSAPTIPLWVLFLAVQLLDILWAPLVLLGVEKVRITPGAPPSTALDFYYMPYTHSLTSALVLSVIAALAYDTLNRKATVRASIIVGFAVLSHWILDFIVHVHDLPLFGNSMKVGLGLWRAAALSLALEGVILFGGIFYYLRGRMRQSIGTIVFCVVLFALQAYTTFSQPPSSMTAGAISAIVAYFLFAAMIWWLEDRRRRVLPAA